jgi:hypothetical protein
MPSSVHDVHNSQVHTRRDVTLLTAFCVTLGAYAIVTRPASPYTAPDTAVYLEGSPLVPPGYPLLLQVIGIDGIAVLQPLIFACALGALGFELLALTRSIVFTLAVIAAIPLIPELMTYHASILTESLFVSGLVAFLAASTRFARAPSWRTLLVAAVIAGIAASIRRTAYAWAPIVMLMALLLWRMPRARGSITLAAGLLPLVTLYTADYVVARYQHGDNMTSLTGRHLFAKAALIEASSHPQQPADALHARVARELDETYAPIRALLREAPDETRASLVLFYETCLQGPCVAGLRESIPLPEARKNELFAAVARERIVLAPAAFTSLTATHYASLWTAYKLRHPDSARALAEFLESHRPLPFEREAFKVEPHAPIVFTPSAAVAWIQPLVIAIGILTAAIAVAGVVSALRAGKPVPLLAASLAALTAHGSLLFTAIGAAGISRFMIAVFPAVVVATALGAWWLTQKALGRSSRARYD